VLYGAIAYGVAEWGVSLFTSGAGAAIGAGSGSAANDSSRATGGNAIGDTGRRGGEGAALAVAINYLVSSHTHVIRSTPPHKVIKPRQNVGQGARVHTGMPANNANPAVENAPFGRAVPGAADAADGHAPGSLPPNATLSDPAFKVLDTSETYRRALEILMAATPFGPEEILDDLAAQIAERLAAKQASRVLLRTPEQLASKFKHAKDFGVPGNYSKANAAEFSRALNQHINSPGTQLIEGTYHRMPVTHYVNPSTGLDVMADSAGNFISGWKLSPEQLRNVMMHGGL
jgi:hypothetical protein